MLTKARPVRRRIRWMSTDDWKYPYVAGNFVRGTSVAGLQRNGETDESPQYWTPMDKKCWEAHWRSNTMPVTRLCRLLYAVPEYLP